MQLPDFKFTYQDFEDYILSHDAYMFDRTYYIDNRGKDVKIVSDDYNEYLAKVQVKLAEQTDTLKVEGIERLSGWKDGTIHAFRYWENSPSFPDHTDPVDVIIEVQEGAKIMIVDSLKYDLRQFETVVIPANTPHRAVNEKEGLMFSYGLSDTEQHYSIRQDD